MGNNKYIIEKSFWYPLDASDVVLCFSGGRDSSCAALKLLDAKRNPLLITVIDSGIQDDTKTEQRVKELHNNVNSPFSWLSIRVPAFYAKVLGIPILTSPSCFNCFMVKLSVAIILAKKHSIDTIATGFTSYQSAWVEQSPTAIEEIENFLGEYGLKLELPVWNLESKEHACRMLSEYSITPRPLEPKCHCADEGTKEHARPEEIRSDFSKLIIPCRHFINTSEEQIK
ncbi:MAG: hypothetical protein OEV87_01270 [Phycisphaerae bacterium]|nr:hypothetical protein [Phycisphaerae bacterium]